MLQQCYSAASHSITIPPAPLSTALGQRSQTQKEKAGRRRALGSFKEKKKCNKTYS